MSENTAPAAVETDEEFDVDAWLDGAKRTERTVTVYRDNHLIGDIDELEAKLRQIPEEVAEDQDLGGTDPASRLQRQIEELYLRLDASKMICRISYLEDTEIDAIRDSALEDLKDDLAEVTKKAREKAFAQARREGLTSPTDVNDFVRAVARAAGSKTIEREVSIRCIAGAMVKPQMNVEQVRRLYSKLGDAQVQLLSQAYSRAANEAPQVAVPKSRKPSQDEETGMSS